MTQIYGKAELEVQEPPRGSTHAENGKSGNKGKREHLKVKTDLMK